MWRVRDIPGMDDWDLDRLIDRKIRTAHGLLYRAASYEARFELHQLTKIELSTLLEYANAADLLRINKVGPKHVYMLRSAECCTIRDLASRNPSNLHADMWEANKSIKMFPPIVWVIKWVAEAKIIPKLITYK